MKAEWKDALAKEKPRGGSYIERGTVVYTVPYVFIIDKNNVPGIAYYDEEARKWYNDNGFECDVAYWLPVPEIEKLDGIK